MGKGGEREREEGEETKKPEEVKQGMPVARRVPIQISSGFREAVGRRRER